MEFRLLGPLEVERDGTSITLSAHKPRVLLAMLLVEAGKVVSWRRLIAELWDGEPPRSALPNLRTYVAQLRQAVLGGGGDARRVVSEPGGFRVVLDDDDQVDLHAYEKWSRAGAEAQADGRLSDAVRCLEKAIRMWRGQPLLDVASGPTLSAAAVALEERHAGIVEDWFDVRLALPLTTSLASDLRKHIASYPFRERPRRQLMLALYRTGDPAAALQAFADARLCFRDSLGIDPSPELQRLQQAVLKRDPALDVPAQAAPETGDQRRQPRIAVCGSKEYDEFERALADQLGRELAAQNGSVLCAGGGIGAVAALGAKAEGGLAVSLSSPPGMEVALSVSSADAVIGIGGSWPALAAVAMAKSRGIPAIAIEGWTVTSAVGAEVSGVQIAKDPTEAVRLAMERPARAVTA